MDMFIKIILPLFTTIISGVNITFILLGFKREGKKYLSSLRGIYIEKIFNEYLINKIPETRNKIIYVEKSGFSSLGDLANIISALRKDILYFKYNSEKFYNELDKMLIEFEDFLASKINKIIEIQGDREEIQNNINKYISQIYKRVDTHYSGK